MLTQTPSTVRLRRFLRLREVQEEYGLGKDAVAKLVAARRLHRARIGAAYMYRREELEALIPRK